jgi:hypothetical protein
MWEQQTNVRDRVVRPCAGKSRGYASSGHTIKVGLMRSILGETSIANKTWVWQVILAHLWQLTLAHLWQLAGEGKGMETRCAPGWSVAKARSTARASISPLSWPCLSRRFAESGSCRRQFR